MVRTAAKTVAQKGLCSERPFWLKLAFRVPFSLVHFFWASKRNEQSIFQTHFVRSYNSIYLAIKQIAFHKYSIPGNKNCVNNATFFNNCVMPGLKYGLTLRFIDYCLPQTLLLMNLKR